MRQKVEENDHDNVLSVFHITMPDVHRIHVFSNCTLVCLDTYDKERGLEPWKHLQHFVSGSLSVEFLA